MAYAIQNARDKQKHGKKAPWYAVWKGKDGKKHSQKVGAKKDALEIAREKERNEQRSATGLTTDVHWSDFRDEYETLGGTGMSSDRSRASARQALAMFERLVNPKLIRGIDVKTLRTFVVKRAKMPGKKNGSTVSSATIKKELRTIRAALSYAVECGYLAHVPKMPPVSGAESEKRFVTPEHFNAMLTALQDAENGPATTFPRDVGIEPSDWWEALLSTLWVAPNRINAMLSLRWENVDLEAGYLVSRATDVKQKKTHRAWIPPVVAEKLAGIRRFDARVFPWNHDITTLYNAFTAIQQAAGIHLLCDGEHEHTPRCHVYGFHDFRRSFATLNGELPSSLVQHQMGHSTFSTTMRYVKYGEGQRSFADKLHLPTALQPEKRAAGV